MATIVSWPLEEMIISLVMNELLKPVCCQPVGCQPRGFVSSSFAERHESRTVGVVSNRVGRTRACSPLQRNRLQRDQFVNLRIRTLRTNPKPARVAIIEDPP